MIVDDKNHLGYYKKLGAQALSEGLNVPNFEIVKNFQMVKNAICIKTPIAGGIRYIVKHYDTIILQWTVNQYETIVIEVLEYNCSPTSNRQIDGILCQILPNLPRGDYNKLPAYHDRKQEFKGSLAWKC